MSITTISLNGVQERVEDAIEEMRRAGDRFARAEAAYRLAKSKAYAEVAHLPNEHARDAEAEQRIVTVEHVDEETGDIRYESRTLNNWRLHRDLARERRWSAYQAVEALKARMSALQTLARADTAEFEAITYGPGNVSEGAA